MSSVPADSETQLSPEERQHLDEADLRLREAVAAYEPFIGRELSPGQPVSAHSFEEIAEAQATIEAAERELWRLREELLGWVRPGWAPSASLVADWFSEDDSIYDRRVP